MTHALFDSEHSSFEASRAIRHTSAGSVELPIVYRDASVLLAYFRVSPERAAALLGDTDLTPIRFGGHAIAGLAMFRYRDTSIGPYNEVGLSLPVHFRDEPPPAHPVLEMWRRAERRRGGLYVLNLPVTTEPARAAGIEIWGYPKFLTRLPIQFSGGRFDGSVEDPGGRTRIMRLSGRPGRGIPVPGADLLLISRRDDQDLRTPVEVDAALHTGGAGSLRLEAGESEHPMAEHLRALGLDGARPAVVQRSERFRSRLHAPVPVRAASAA